MSASLVGSEMCIRDRQKRMGGRAVHPLGRTREVPCGVCTRATISIGAVSYTHLTLPTICSV
eukprot:13449-Alexandrium_andersonii.AAC.1